MLHVNINKGILLLIPHTLQYFYLHPQDLVDSSKQQRTYIILVEFIH